MDRIIGYTLETPEVSDFLNIQNNAMIALGYLAEGVCGSNTWVSGLAATATSPASMTINIGPGSIWSLEVVDSTAYGDSGGLPANSNPLVKGGIVQTTTPFTLVAPTVSGQSVVYLLAATFTETDGTAENLSFYNTTTSSAPTTELLNTVRSQICTLELIRGTAATTGTQTTPATPVGYVPLYTMTVAYGQTTVTAANILVASGAPFLPNILSGLRKPVYGTTLNLYVGPTGVDTNPGTSSLYPFLTINGALAAAAQDYDFANAKIVVNLAAGSYGGCTVNGASLPVSVTLLGNTATPSSVTINGASVGAVNCTNAGNVTVEGVTLVATGTGAGAGEGICLNAQGGTIGLGPGIIFGNASFAHIAGQVSGFVGWSGGTGYTISGSAPSHYYTGSNGLINMSSSTITLASTVPAFSTAFASCSGGVMTLTGMTFSGTASGVRYNASSYGVIQTNGGSASYLPGSSAGTTSNGIYE